MYRISTMGAHNNYMARLLETQKRVDEFQTQVSSRKVSQSYIGVAKDATRLINTENELTASKAFIDRNISTNIELESMGNSLDFAMSRVNEFLSRLEHYATDNKTDETAVDTIQQEAFHAMIDLQGSLNVSVDGQFLFAGGKVNSQPVDFNVSTLAQFQSSYDGMNITYPTIAPAQMQDLNLRPAMTGGVYFNADGTLKSVNATGLREVHVGSTITVSGSASNDQTYTVVSKADDQTITVSRLIDEPASAAAVITYLDASGASVALGPAITGNLSFSPIGDTITSASVGALNNIPVGTVFTVSGSANGNDGIYQIKSLDATNSIITIESVKMTTEGTALAPVNATISSSSWYKGDELLQQRRVDNNQTIETGVLAKNSAFEKAFRAMAIIAQGVFGTAGGLDKHPERIDAARYLLRDAQSSPTSGTPPYGAEPEGDLLELQARLSWHQNVIATKNEKHNQFAVFLEGRAADIENVDPVEASVRLMDEMNVLNASYATLAKVSQLSILDFMR